MNIVQTIFYKALLLVAIGAVTVSISEFWFYEVTEETSSLFILLAYGFVGYLSLLIWEKYSIKSFAGFYIIAAIFGWLIEGAVVPVMFMGLPLTIFWTSITWHALITMGVGLYWFRKIMATESWLKAAAYNLAFGAGLGLWGAYLWNANEIEGSTEVNFVWQDPTLFIEQFVFAFVLFIGGHLLLDFLQWRNFSLKTNNIEIALFAIPAAIWGALVAAQAFPFSLSLPILLVLCIWLLKRGEGLTDTKYVSPFSLRIPLLRYVLCASMPLAAYGMYVFIFTNEIKFEANAAIMLIGGPISIWLLGKSMWQLYTARK